MPRSIQRSLLAKGLRLGTQLTTPRWVGAVALLAGATSSLQAQTLQQHPVSQHESTRQAPARIERLPNVPVVPRAFHAQNQANTHTHLHTKPVAARPIAYTRPVAQEAPPTQLGETGQTAPLPEVMPPNIQAAPLSQDGPEGGDEQIQAPPGNQSAPDKPTTGYAGESQLSIADVIASVYQSFPMIQAARQERQIAGGQLQQAWGAYDTKLQGYSLSEPTGFYRNFRNGIGVARQTWWGGYVSAGYRIGRGDFQPWYKERETNEGGEFKLAFAQPLLQGRAIDPQRVAVFQASLATRAADPIVQLAILETAQEAATVYWQWVAAGAFLKAQRELLDLAINRGTELQLDFEANRRPDVELDYNRQLVAARTLEMNKAAQKFNEVSNKLSIYIRDEAGRPIAPGLEWIPQHFPVIQSFPQKDFATDFSAALSRRPEPQLLRFEMQQVEMDRRLARNDMLPSLDVIAEASQDTGIRASSSNDKGQFELLVGLQGEVPLQRNKALGKFTETTGKINQVAAKLQLTRNKIEAELRRARFALDLSEQNIIQAEEALRLSIGVLSSYQEAYRLGIGKTNLIDINILETKVNENEIKLVEAQQNWFIALADLQAILGLNPLDQAMNVSQLPESKRAAPGFLPQPEPVQPEKLKADFELLDNPVPREP